MVLDCHATDSLRMRGYIRGHKSIPKASSGRRNIRYISNFTLLYLPLSLLLSIPLLWDLIPWLKTPYLAGSELFWFEACFASHNNRYLQGQYWGRTLRMESVGFYKTPQHHEQVCSIWIIQPSDFASQQKGIMASTSTQQWDPALSHTSRRSLDLSDISHLRSIWWRVLELLWLIWYPSLKNDWRTLAHVQKICLCGWRVYGESSM